jgi:hypothetical protein
MMDIIDYLLGLAVFLLISFPVWVEPIVRKVRRRG